MLLIFTIEYTYIYTLNRVPDSLLMALRERELASDGSTANVGGIYGTPQRNMVGYGSHAPDPKWPGGVSGESCRHTTCNTNKRQEPEATHDVTPYIRLRSTPPRGITKHAKQNPKGGNPYLQFRCKKKDCAYSSQFLSCTSADPNRNRNPNPIP